MHGNRRYDNPRLTEESVEMAAIVMFNQTAWNEGNGHGFTCWDDVTMEVRDRWRVRARGVLEAVESRLS